MYVHPDLILSSQYSAFEFLCPFLDLELFNLRILNRPRGGGLSPDRQRNVRPQPVWSVLGPRSGRPLLYIRQGKRTMILIHSVFLSDYYAGCPDFKVSLRKDFEWVTSCRQIR
jgi:hypothetical protein